MAPINNNDLSINDDMGKEFRKNPLPKRQIRNFIKIN